MIKKTVLVLLTITLFLANNLNAQQKEKKKIEQVSAISIGGTYSSISNIEGKYKIGVTALLYQEYKIAKKISFVTEIGYSQLGINGNEDKIRLHYLSAPLEVKIYLSKKIGLLTGLNSDILLGSNQSKGKFQWLSSSIPIKINFNINPFLQLSANYNIGINDINKGYDSETILKNNWFGISVLFIKL